MFQLQLLHRILGNMPTQALERCYTCKVLLDDRNWLPSAKKRGSRICRQCKAAKLIKIKDDVNNDPIRKANQLSVRQICRLKTRFETMLAYGNKCANCNEDKILFLTIDHINNNGHLDKEEIGGGGVDLYGYLRRLGYPGKGTQIQILCHNCNGAKERKLRKQGNATINRNSIKEVYTKQEYSISKELDNELKAKSKELFDKLEAKRNKRAQ
jgi:hypothetical protein